MLQYAELSTETNTWETLEYGDPACSMGITYYSCFNVRLWGARARGWLKNKCGMGRENSKSLGVVVQV